MVHINGTVTDAESGVPILNSQALVGRRNTLGQIYWYPQRNRDATKPGNFGIDAIVEDEDSGIAIRIEAPGHYAAVTRFFPASEQSVILNLKLKRGPDILANAIDPDGHPATSASATVAIPGETIGIYKAKFMNLNFQSVIASRADGTGRIAIRPQMPPFAIVVIDDNGMAVVDQKALAKSSNVRLQAWGHIDGRLMIGNKPWAKQGIRVRSADRRTADKPYIFFSDFSHTQSDGSFVFDKAAPIPLQICRTLNWHQAAGGQGDIMVTTQQTYVNLKPSQTLKVQLGGTGRPVIGKVQVPPELAGRKDWCFRFDCGIIPQADVGIPTGNFPRYFVPVAPDGSFRVDDIPSGDYTLYINIGAGDYAQTNLASSASPFTIPPIPTGRSDQPLDLGLIKMKMQ